MPAISWAASFIFLGLSVSIGLLAYLFLYGRKKSGKDKRESELERELRSDPDLHDVYTDASDQPATLKELEERYKKKG